MKNIEYYSGTIESFFAAKYEGDSGYEDFVVVGLDKEFGSLQTIKSPVFTFDSAIQKRIQTRLSIRLDYIFSCGESIIGNDTISYISFSSYDPYSTSTYLLKNYEIKDSVKENYIIKTLTPVPIANNKKGFYVTKAGVPETDFIWEQFMSIDFKTSKFKFYDDNKINYRR